MLTSADPQRLALAERLKEAISHAASKARVAAACDVTEQAVTGWLKTGRIHKKHLPVIARLTGHELLWLLTGQGPKTAHIAPPSIAETSGLSYRHRALIGLFDGLTEAQQQEEIKGLQEKKRLNDELLEQLLQRKSAS